MAQSTITIDVTLDPGKVPQHINWKAGENGNDAKAMMLAFWDGADKTAMRIDLWTKEMMVDEMADFFYQTIMTMAETYHRATQDQELTDEMKEFAKKFYQKFRDKQLKES